MEEQSPSRPAARTQPPEVLTVRNWKEYLGESLLIIFSVLLALLLTEWISGLHEKQQTRELISGIREELTRNKAKEQEQYQYDQQVLRSIDSALANPVLLQTVVSNGEFHLARIAPDGVLYRYLDHAAWQTAQNHDILSRIPPPTLAGLIRIYEEQTRIAKVEDEVGRVILDRQAGRPELARETLILIRNCYHAWAVDRAPGLLKSYAEVIASLDHL